MMTHARARIVAALLASALLVGCKQPAAPQSAAPTSAPVFDRSTPESTARALLATLRAELHAIAEHDEPYAKRLHAEAVTLADVATLQKRLDAAPQYRVVLGDDEISSVVDFWGAGIGFYVDNLELDHVHTATPLADDQLNATVLAPTSAADHAVIRVRCTKLSDGRWAVSAVDFAPPGEDAG